MVYILLGAGFEEAEALVTADVLRRADIPVTLAGIGGELIAGSHGIAVRADRPVEEVVLEQGDMVVLPGGMGGVASIEGLLPRGTRCVCYPGLEDALSEAGAVPVMDRPAVAQGRLITGKGPGAAFDFGLALAEALAGPEAAAQVRAGLHYGV